MMFRKPQEKPYTISYEDQEDLEGSVVMKRPFIVCVPLSQFIDKDNIPSAFDAIRDETYRIILPADANQDAVKEFKTAIQALHCAKAIEKEHEDYLTPSASPSRRQY